MKTIFKNISIITQDKNSAIIKRGFIVVENEKILKVCSGKFKVKNNKNNTIINGQGKIAIPGLINSHIHLGESAFPFFLPLKYSLEKYLYLTEKLIKDHPEFETYRNVISDYSILLSLKSGTTTIAGGRVHDSAQKWGVRYISGIMVMNSDKLRKFYNKTDEDIKKMKKEISMDLGSLAIFIHSLPFIDKNKINEISKIKKTNKTLPIFIHFLETKKERDSIKKYWHKSPIKILKEAKLFNKYTHLIHCNWVTKKELQNIIESGCNIIQCPSTNIIVDNKILDLKEIIENNGRVSIATDGLSTGKSLNLLKEAKTAYEYHNRKKETMSAKNIFDLITIEASKNLKLNKKIGSLEVNKKADIAFLDNKININSYNLYKDIINNGRISGVMINGKLIIWNNKVIKKLFSEQNIKKKYKSLIRKIKSSPTTEERLNKLK